MPVSPFLWHRNFSLSAFLHLSTLVASTFLPVFEKRLDVATCYHRRTRPNVTTSFQSRAETKVADKDTARRKKVSRGSEFQKYRVFPVDIIKTGFPVGPSSVINVESFMNFIGSLSPRVSIVYSFRWRRIR